MLVPSHVFIAWDVTSVGLHAGRGPRPPQRMMQMGPGAEVEVTLPSPTKSAASFERRNNGMCRLSGKCVSSPGQSSRYCTRASLLRRNDCTNHRFHKLQPCIRAGASWKCMTIPMSKTLEISGVTHQRHHCSLRVCRALREDMSGSHPAESWLEQPIASGSASTKECTSRSEDARSPLCTGRQRCRTTIATLTVFIFSLSHYCDDCPLGRSEVIKTRRAVYRST